MKTKWKVGVLTSLLAGLFATGVAAGPVVKEYILTEVSYPILVNGNLSSVSDPLLNLNGKTYVPLKAIGELLGADVQWNDANRRIEIGERIPQKNAVTVDGFTFSNLNVRQGAVGSYLLADIENNTGKSYKRAYFGISLYDKAGNLLVKEGLHAQMLENGETNSFEALVDAEINEYANARFQVEWLDEM